LKSARHCRVHRILLPTFRDDQPKRPSELEQDGPEDASDLPPASSNFSENRNLQGGNTPLD
jgi:hypothetical protein